MENQSNPRIQNEIREKKEWIKPEIFDLSVNSGFPVKNIEDLFADIAAS